MSRKRDCLLRSTRKFTFFFFFWRRIGATWIFHEFFFFVPCTHLLACFCSTCFPTAAFEMFSFDCDKKKSCVCVCVFFHYPHSLSCTLYLSSIRSSLSCRTAFSYISCVCLCVFLLYGLRSLHTSPSTLVYHSDRSSATATQYKERKIGFYYAGRRGEPNGGTVGIDVTGESCPASTLLPLSSQRCQ